MSLNNRGSLENSVYIDTASDTCIQVYKELLELLDVRIRSLDDLSKELSKQA
jgi:hypothetical protein